jgi:hypothetical protein
MTKTYNIGWYKYTPDQLETLYPGELAAYRDEAQSIVPWGSTEACWRETPDEAEDYLRQIIAVNSENNLRALTPLGASGLFIIERCDLGSISKFSPKALNLTVKVKGKSTEDLLIALEEVSRLIEEGFTSSLNSNGFGSFEFTVMNEPRQRPATAGES